MGIGTIIAVSGLGVSAMRFVRALDAEFNTDKKTTNQDKVQTVDGVDGVGQVNNKVVNRAKPGNPYASINLLKQDFITEEIVVPRAVQSYELAQKALISEGLDYPK